MAGGNEMIKRQTAYCNDESDLFGQPLALYSNKQSQELIGFAKEKLILTHAQSTACPGDSLGISLATSSASQVDLVAPP